MSRCACVTRSSGLAPEGYNPKAHTPPLVVIRGASAAARRRPPAAMKRHVCMTKRAYTECPVSPASTTATSATAIRTRPSRWRLPHARDPTPRRCAVCHPSPRRPRPPRSPGPRVSLPGCALQPSSSTRSPPSPPLGHAAKQPSAPGSFVAPCHADSATLPPDTHLTTQLTCHSPRRRMSPTRRLLPQQAPASRSRSINRPSPPSALTAAQPAAAPAPSSASDPPPNCLPSATPSPPHSPCPSPPSAAYAPGPPALAACAARAPPK